MYLLYHLKESPLAALTVPLHTHTHPHEVKKGVTHLGKRQPSFRNSGISLQL